MASFGAQYPVFAPFYGEEPDNALPKYGASTVLGKLVSAGVTITKATGELYADDELAEKIEEFVNAVIAMETDDMLPEAEAALFGATKTEDGEIIDSVNDAAPYGGLAYIKVLMRKGVKVYKVYYYPKVKAALGDDTATTKSGSITFGTAKANFTVFAPKNGEWRYRSEFATMEEAQAYVAEKLANSAIVS